MNTVDTLESLLLEPHDLGSLALRRAKARGLDPDLYAELVSWAAYLKINRGLRPASVSNYLDGACSLLVWLRDNGYGLAELTAPVAEAWQRELYLARGENPQTRSLRLVASRQFFVWREGQGRGVSPISSVRGPRKAIRVARKYSRAQLRAMLRSCDRNTIDGRRAYSVLLFVYATGARKEELVTLTLAQLTMRQRVGEVRFTGKGAKERVVGFEGPVVPALQEWLADRDAMEVVDCDAVWLGVRGRYRGRRLGANGFLSIANRACRAAGITENGEIGLHRLRATFATNLYDFGEDLKIIKELMGHNDLRTTERYIAISERRLRARMPSADLYELTGEKTHAEPLWVKRKLKQRRAF